MYTSKFIALNLLECRYFHGWVRLHNVTLTAWTGSEWLAEMKRIFQKQNTRRCK